MPAGYGGILGESLGESLIEEYIWTLPLFTQLMAINSDEYIACINQLKIDMVKYRTHINCHAVIGRRSG